MSERLSSAPRSSLSGQGERLATRRRNRRLNILFALGILFAVLSTGIIYELNQDPVRIAHVQIFGADQSLATIALAAMQGSYLGLIPRDSIFFYPAASIRSNILSAHPDIAAISLFRNGLTGLSIRIDTRVPIALWCGESDGKSDFKPESSKSFFSDDNCYLFDASGFIYATAATSTKPLNTFVLYAPLARETLEPLLVTIAQAEKLPAAFDFARQLDTFGSPVASVILRDGEADDYLASGTRITYVLGDERDAFTALVSARENLNLADGSLEYVDLRFDGKVYLKKK